VNNNAPIAFFKHERDGRKIRFNASDSVDDSWDMEGFVYRWDFGDGSEIETDDPVVYHEYSFGGTFNVNLTILDPEGERGYHTAKVNAPGMRIIDWLIIFIVIFIIIAILGALLFVYFRNRMQNEDKGLLEILGISEEGGEEEEDTGGFSKVRRTQPEGGKMVDFKRPKSTSDDPGKREKHRKPDSERKDGPDHARKLQGFGR
jgi:hypothetical protein